MAKEYHLNVAGISRLSPHMIRINLIGDDLAGFPPDQASGYVKLLVSDGNGASLMRSYTIRSFDPARLELVLDFVDHGDSGPASAWARQCQLGHSMTIRGPGEKKLVDPTADWFLLAGDLSALPALAVNLEQLPSDARGYALIEVPSAEDIQSLAAPADIDVRWLVNDDVTEPNRVLIDTLLAVDWLPGTPYPWFAGEFDAMRRARRYFRDERGIDKRAMYVSCYWKLGDTDEGMKRAKRLDAEQDLAAAAAG